MFCKQIKLIQCNRLNSLLVKARSRKNVNLRMFDETIWLKLLVESDAVPDVINIQPLVSVSLMKRRTDSHLSNVRLAWMPAAAFQSVAMTTVTSSRCVQVL